MEVGTEQDPTLNLVGSDRYNNLWIIPELLDTTEGDRERERYAFDPVRNMDIAQLLYWALRNRPTCN